VLLRATGDGTPNAYRYTGEQWDTDLGMYFLRARYLDPETGRFHTLDTYEGSRSDPQTLHKYLYAHANPVMGVDPSGNEWSLVGTLAKLAVVAVVASVGLAVAQRSMYGHSTETWEECYARMLDPIEEQLAFADAIGWYGLGSFATASSAELATRLASHVGQEAQRNAAIAGALAWDKGSGPFRMYKAASAARKGASQAVRLRVVNGGLASVSKWTGVIGIGATGISVISRAAAASYCGVLVYE